MKNNQEKKQRFLYGKRVCLSASVSLEAALVISTFMIVVLTIAGFISLLSTQLLTLRTINNVSMESSKAKYYVQMSVENTSEYEKQVDTMFLSARIIASGGMVNNNMVKHINTLKSRMDNGKVDVIVSYDSYLPFGVNGFYVTQRAMTKDWTGVDITEDKEEVYITKNGRVYHRSLECSHLIINISKTSLEEAKTMRNESGGKYRPCQYCINQKLLPGSSVFITTDGDCYHKTLQCSGLTRNIITIDIKDIGEKSPCSECG